MGSPVSPFFADIVMDDLETHCLRKLKFEKNIVPLFYDRYVDDILMCIKKSDLLWILETFHLFQRTVRIYFWNWKR